MNKLKPTLVKKLDNLLSESLYYMEEIDLPYFGTDFHYHEECQLSYIVESTGKRLVADDVTAFGPGDLSFMGPHLPHVWMNDPAYFQGNEQYRARSIILFFYPEPLLQALSCFSNMDKVAAMLNRGKRGIDFFGDTRERIATLLQKMLHLEEGLPQLMALLEVLQLMSGAAEYTYITGNGYQHPQPQRENQRLNQVLAYVFEHFRDEITLSTVAAAVNMNPHAFCRFFKMHTQKTFVDFLTEVRIAHACKMLGQQYSDITSLAFECGFNNISNFNRCFKSLKGITPRDYRKKLQLLEWD
jgi:AraC-like DNA-binding protein